MKNIAFLVIAFMYSINIFASGTAVINGKAIKTREELHTTLATSLKFPKFYGKNLDALYDTLVADTSGESIIRVKNLSILRARVGNEYVQSFLETIGDASEQNPRVILLLE